MSRDYAEKEREFIESLKEDTGRDLAEWMRVIEAQKFEHRNDIIDWLRQQGFLFAWASWLERIYHNGGKPIYFDEAARKPVSSAPPAGAAKTTQPPTRPMTPKVLSDPPPQSQPAAGAGAGNAPSGGDLTPEIKSLVASARAYAPLAGYLIRRIKEAIPNAQFEAGPKHIAMHTGAQPFAHWAIGPKNLKIAFSGPPGVYEAPFEKVRIANLGSPLPATLTHMIALTDARQIDEAFVDTMIAAQARSEIT